jgi:4-hydroxybenzoate polyprenyltransferase
MTYVRAFFTVSRYEFMMGGVFFLFFVSALASRTWPQLQHNWPLIVLGTVVWYLSHLIGSQVNCLADYDTDWKYKRHLVTAVNRLGKRPIIVLIVAETLLAFVAATDISRLTGRSILTILWIVGWFITAFYSLEPFRLKRRGILNPISLSLVLYFLPVAFGYLTLTTAVDWVVLLVLAATGCQMFSLILMNEVEDIPEDASQAIDTPCVLYGVWPVSVAALALFLLGAIGTIVGLSLLMASPGDRLLFVTTAAIGQLVVSSDIYRLSRAARQCRTAESRSALLEVIRHCGGRNWLHFAILGLTIATGSAFTLK